MKIEAPKEDPIKPVDIEKGPIEAPTPTKVVQLPAIKSSYLSEEVHHSQTTEFLGNL